MPEYFFHVGIELFRKDNIESNHISQITHALEPFTVQQHKQHAHILKQPTAPKTVHLPVGTKSSALDDRRLDHISVDSFNMDVAHASKGGCSDAQDNSITSGMGNGAVAYQTRAHFESLPDAQEQSEWGIVHLYRDLEETPRLYQKSKQNLPTDAWNGSASASRRSSGRGVGAESKRPPRDEECTTLCILAVPSYLTPQQFLNFVGNDTQRVVTHFRMIRTEKVNRYMVLLKFRDGKVARQWQADWNGKLFFHAEPETCHVVFVKSVRVAQPSPASEMPSGQSSVVSEPTASRSVTANQTLAITKPLAPPTPSLVELPTCPVCLERMDETSGLLTILCQHVFHCTCLEKWSGGGCPVCRYIHDDFTSGTTSKQSKKKRLTANGEYELSEQPLECEECHIGEALWQCLICGKIGCGRYAGKHAFAHFKETGHNFSLDMESKRVWDYEGDAYVHRIIADATSTSNEKRNESHASGRERRTTALEDEDENLNAAKNENLAFEYTQLLTSQLASQRDYFEEIVARSVDKASEAAQKAEAAGRDIEKLQITMEQTNKDNADLREKLADVEKESSRLKARHRKLEDTSRNLTASYRDEKALSDSVLTKIKAMEDDIATKDLIIEHLQQELSGMATFQSQAKERLQDAVNDGVLDPEDLPGASIELASSALQQTIKAPVLDVHSLLGDDLKLASQWDKASATKLLLEAGLFEKVEEDGLYDEAGPEAPTSNNAVSAAKKKNRNKKKKK